MKIYKDKETNNILLMINELCKKEYDNFKELKVGESDGAVEKHIPVYEIKDNKIYISVGSTMHPMSDEHYIMWIALVGNKTINIKKLNPMDEPKAIFEYNDENEIYAYCNIHGLWRKKIEK